MADPRNWWMYHGNPQHTGAVVGSVLDASNVSGLTALAPTDLPNGQVLSVPALWENVAFIGTWCPTGDQSAYFYSINLANGLIIATHEVKAPPPRLAIRTLRCGRGALGSRVLRLL
jgi:hypothetical protein